MKKPDINEENTIPVFDGKFVRVYDLQYREGKHYFNASRRAKEDLVCLKDDEAFRRMLPDAVTCFVILRVQGGEPRLLLSKEFRYPANRFLTSPPAGLIDKADAESENPVESAFIREVYEETGLRIDSVESVEIVNPLLFSTPGLSDESNALACAVLEVADLSGLTQDHAEESECFDGFLQVTRREAEILLQNGRDKAGNFYSVYTWCALMWFLSGRWDR